MDRKVKSIPSHELPLKVGITILAMLNPQAITVVYPDEHGLQYRFVDPDHHYHYLDARGSKGAPIILTDVEPDQLIYPDGWYYNHGVYQNLHLNAMQPLHQVKMFTKRGEAWGQRTDPVSA